MGVGARIFPADIDNCEFAKFVLRRVSNIAADIAIQQKSCAAGEISAQLYIAQTALGSTDPAFEGRLESGNNQHKHSVVLFSSPSFQPATYRLEQQADQTARKGIAAFVAAPDAVKSSYLKKLRHFSKRFGPSPGEDRKTVVLPTSDPDEYPNHVNSNLYATLRSHSCCTCDLPRSYTGTKSRHHAARLRLRGSIIQQDGNIVFDMLFSSSPTSYEFWQDLQLQVAKSKGKKVVRYKDEDRKTSAARPPRVLEVGSFCGLLGSIIGSRLCLRLQDSFLHQSYEGLPILQDVEPGPSISLRRILQTHRLSNKMKLVLSYIVARSVWQFYDSPWMASPWSSDTIHFLFEPSSGRTHSSRDVYACRPYYSVDFDEPGEGSHEYCDSFAVIYRYPRLLELCIILLEVGRGQSLELANVGSFEAKVNANWNLAQRLIEDTRWGDFDYPDFRDAIKQCLDSRVFDQDSIYSGKPSQDLDHDIPSRRRVLYEIVVAPLGRMIKSLGYSKALEDLEPIDPRGPGPVLSAPLTDSKVSRGYTAGSTEHHRDTERSRQWLESILEINRNFCNAYPKAARTATPVKIAILDTGYDKDATFFQIPARARQAKGWKDFTNESSQVPIDLCGHGTHTLSLAMKIAPLAHFYVARVVRDRDGMKDAPQSICQAIQWADEVCKADIISMSFGFLDEVSTISMAIRQVVLSRADRILFFAAASNSGGNRREMFPASHDSVVSIRQTNAQGSFSDTNPPADPHGPAVYGTLGLSVPSAWLRNMDGELAKSGSSVATAVAAGIAAMMLSFANIGLSQSVFHNSLDVQNLWTRRGMLALFAKMAEDMGNRCMFLSPLKFFSERDASKCWASIADACT